MSNDIKNMSYMERVALYQQMKGAKPNLIRLFLKKENKYNSDKLDYELSKLADSQVNTTYTKKSTTSNVINVVNSERDSAKLGFFRLNQLHKDLHGIARKQRDFFQQAISLKLQLNDLHADDEVRALYICIQIEDIFDEIDNIQKILTHYVEHNVVLQQKPSDFSTLSPANLLQRRNNKRANKSKIVKKINELESLMLENSDELTIADKTKIEVLLERYNSKLYALDNDIIELNKLIN